MRFVILGDNCECSQLQSIGLDNLQNIMNRRQTATKWIDVFQSPLQKACICSQLEIVKIQLQEMLTQPNQMSSEILALDIAAGNGDLETVMNLCDNFRCLLDQPDPSGLAIPVVRASNGGHKEVTRYLYDKTKLEVLMLGDGYWATCLLLDAILYGFLGKSFEYLVSN